MKIALANLPYPSSHIDAVDRVLAAMITAAEGGAEFICFPECYLPGYRGDGYTPADADRDYLDQNWRVIERKARDLKIAVVLGTERIWQGSLYISSLIIDAYGRSIGFQDKVQLDPSEESIYTAGFGRKVFDLGGLKFGVVICHEGWRYPEAVRWAVREGAQVVFHPHLSVPEEGFVAPKEFAEPGNTIHEKAAITRAAENGCYFVSVNYCIENAPTTSAVIDPTGKVLAYQPYGEAGVLFCDIDPALATAQFAKRLRRHTGPAINRYCPNSGQPVIEGATVEYKGSVVGFCNRSCRDEFEKDQESDTKAKRYFDVILKEQQG